VFAISAEQVVRNSHSFIQFQSASTPWSGVMQDENPYQAPKETVLAELADYRPLEQESFYVASSGRRFANYILDSTACFILYFLFGLAVGTVGNAIFGNAWTSKILYYFGVIIIPVLSMVTIAAYYVLPEFVWGKTFGKLVTRTIVITADGRRPSLGQIIGRTLARFIPFEPLAFILLGSYPVGLHDSLSHTRVVEDR
jgi:uncharacterized RDD family membrane protein YckC